MKNIVLLLLFLLTGLIVTKAQTYETIGVLQPFQETKVKKSDMKKIAVESLDLTSIDFDISLETITLPNSTTGLAVSIKIPNKEIVFEDRNKISEAYLNIFGRVTSLDKKRSFFEERLLINLSKDKDEAMKDTTTYRKVYELAPGIYKIEIVVKDTKSGNKGIRAVGFEIPRPSLMKN